MRIFLFHLILSTSFCHAHYLDTAYYEPTSQEDVKLFFDKYGQLYPEQYFRKHGFADLDILYDEGLLYEPPGDYPFIDKIQDLNVILEELPLKGNSKILQFPKSEVQDALNHWDFSLFDYFYYSKQVFTLYKECGIKSKHVKGDTKNVNKKLFESIQEYLMDKKIDTIRQIYDQRIRDFNEPPKILFFIHGYNNSYELVSDQVNNIRSTFVDEVDNESNVIFISVYWYGLSCKFKDKRNKCGVLKNKKIESLKAFRPSILSSYMVGIEFRRFMNKLSQRFSTNESPKFHLLSHSLGANVISSALVNHSEKMREIVWKEKRWDKLWNANYVSKTTYPLKQRPEYDLPSNEIIACLGAAAIPGWSFNSLDTLKTNCKIIIGFNNQDRTLKKFVLSEKTELIGLTDLGCNDKSLADAMSVIPNHLFMENIGDMPRPKQHDHACYIQGQGYEKFFWRWLNE